jgi:hypothetical protein
MIISEDKILASAEKLIRERHVTHKLTSNNASKNILLGMLEYY